MIAPCRWCVCRTSNGRVPVGIASLEPVRVALGNEDVIGPEASPLSPNPAGPSVMGVNPLEVQ